MAAGDELLEGLMRLVKGVNRVDVGDVARPVTAARKEALGKMLPKADDWGWKGGKPGEVSGTEWTKEYDRLWGIVRGMEKSKGAKSWYIINDKARVDELYPFATEEQKDAVIQLRNLYDRGVAQLTGQTKKGDRLSSFWKDNVTMSGYRQSGRSPKTLEGKWDATKNVMRVFADMEARGIPRDVTGKLFDMYRAILHNGLLSRGLFDDFIAGVKNIPATNRADFITKINKLQLYIGRRALEALAAIGRSGETLTAEQREMFMALIPYWHMSVDDLLETVKLLDV